MRKKSNGKEVNPMKKSALMVSNLLLASTIFAAFPTAGAEELLVRQPLELSGYCHMKFPPMREETLSWGQPMLDESAGNTIDFYGPCDYNPTGITERARQRRNSVYQDSE
jgi:hypothetical protein